VRDPALSAADNSGLDASELEVVLRLFVAESEEGLTLMESGLLRLEQHPGDSETAARVFRAAHTLKGNSGAFGLTALGALAHTVEDVLDDLREGRSPVTPERITLLLEGVDALRQLLARGSEAPQELRGPHAELRRRLAASRRVAAGAEYRVDRGPGLTAVTDTGTLRITFGLFFPT
jgi:two-component system chemotaxis sensor kinase CheA